MRALRENPSPPLEALLHPAVLVRMVGLGIDDQRDPSNVKRPLNLMVI
jgi:hypothetical protein